VKVYFEHGLNFQLDILKLELKGQHKKKGINLNL